MIWEFERYDLSSPVAQNHTMAVEVSWLIDREKKNPLLRATRITISWFHGLIGSDQKRVQAYPLNAAKETIHLLWDIGIVRFVERKGVVIHRYGGASWLMTGEAYEVR